jgi:adenylate cyclase
VAVSIDGQIQELNQWLLQEELNGRGSVSAGNMLCDKLLSMGVPICRGHVLVITLHPLYHGHSFLWRQGEGAREKPWSHDEQSHPGWLKSVFYALTEEGEVARFRFDLRDPGAGAEFPMMHELRADGITDYVAFRMTFSNGSFHAASFATDAPGGFSEADRTLLFGLERLLSIRLEVAIRRLLSQVILGAYLGKDAAQRVLAGDIRRDRMTTISSVIWMSDLRGFTAMSDRLPPEVLLQLLGDYFSVVVEAVQGEGGEVLKFIGDAVLAVFRVESRSLTEACEAAARAALAVERRLAVVNAEREAVEKPPIRQGIGLHFGEVNYGNVGSQERLDFTVIGAAVNTTARIEALCGTLKQSILMSEDFARSLSRPTRSFGEHRLKGITTPLRVYGLAETKPKG